MNINDTPEYDPRGDIEDLKELVQTLASKQEETIEYIQKSMESVIESVRAFDGTENGMSCQCEDVDLDSVNETLADLEVAIEDVQRTLATIPTLIRDNENRAKHGGIKLTGMVDADVDLDAEDELERAKRVVHEAGRASATLLQRKLAVGYAKATRLIDRLEEDGIIGPAIKGKAREVLDESDIDLS